MKYFVFKLALTVNQKSSNLTQTQLRSNLEFCETLSYLAKFDVELKSCLSLCETLLRKALQYTCKQNVNFCQEMLRICDAVMSIEMALLYAEHSSL